MTEVEALSLMKSPRDVRPVWRGGVLQIWVTRACDLACINCTQGSQLAGRPGFMTPDQFRVACNSLSSFTYATGPESYEEIPAYNGVVGMFGGNPCVHPQFEELCAIMREYIPFDQRGLWSNNLMGHGKVCRKTFNPDVSNLNVHLNPKAYEEMLRDWPLSEPKGLYEDSRHSPTLVAMKDMEDMTDEERWELISGCDVNQRWSALIGVFRGKLRGYFCELAGAQAMLHEREPDYPDTGVEIRPGWWNRGMEAFKEQVRFHCFACGHPLRGEGDFAQTGTTEQVSKTHVGVYTLKRPVGKRVELISKRSELGKPVSAATQYLSTEAP
jgi:hypothetical protein